MSEAWKCKWLSSLYYGLLCCTLTDPRTPCPLGLLVCGWFYMPVFMCVCMHACRQVYSQMSVHCSDSRTFNLDPHSPSADSAHLPHQQSLTFPLYHCFLTFALARLLSSSLHKTVSAFHLILPPTMSTNPTWVLTLLTSSFFAYFVVLVCWCFESPKLV